MKEDAPFSSANGFKQDSFRLSLVGFRIVEQTRRRSGCRAYRTLNLFFAESGLHGLLAPRGAIVRSFSRDANRLAGQLYSVHSTHLAPEIRALMCQLDYALSSHRPPTGISARRSCKDCVPRRSRPCTRGKVGDGILLFRR